MQPNVCWICETTEILVKDQRGKYSPNEKYCLISLVFSNETVAKSAVCVNCANSLTDEKIEKLNKKFIEVWKNEAVGWASDKQLKHIDELEVKAYDIGESEALEKFKLKKNEEFKNHLEQVEIQRDIKKKLKEKGHLAA